MQVSRFGIAEEPQSYPEDYCNYCEREGHTFSQCPARDDEYAADEEI